MCTRDMIYFTIKNCKDRACGVNFSLGNSPRSRLKKMTRIRKNDTRETSFSRKYDSEPSATLRLAGKMSQDFRNDSVN